MGRKGVIVLDKRQKEVAQVCVLRESLLPKEEHICLKVLYVYPKLFFPLKYIAQC